MNGMRKVFYFLMSMALAVLALSSGAAFGADKTYTLTMLPLTGTSPIATMTATFTNQGNSSFNSLQLTVPANYAISGTPTANRGSVSYSGGVITVRDINLPVGSGEVIRVTMTGVATSGATCNAVAGNWTAVLWTGSALSGNNFRQVSPSSTSTSIAPVCYTIQASAGANGSISPSGTTTVNSGGSQAYTIAGNTGYHVANVLVDGVSVGAVSSYTFSNVTASHTISASFAINTYTIGASPGANGTISPSGTTTVNSGGSQAYTIAGNTGIPSYHVANVLVDGVSVGAVSSYTFSNVTANHTISASFAIDTYTIVASAGTNGSISPPGTTTVNSGGSLAYTIAGNIGYYVTDVLADGVSVGAVSSYTFSGVTANHTISASFARKTLTIVQPAPTTAALNTSFDVTVGLNPAAPDGTIFSIGSNCQATATLSSTATSATYSITIPSTFTGSTCDITLNATNYQSASLTGLKVYSGVLGCAIDDNFAGNPLLDPDTDGPFVGQAPDYAGGYGLRRGPNLDDLTGDNCVKVNFTFTRNPDNTASLLYDKSTGQQAQFEYVILWNPVTLSTYLSGWPGVQPLVTWGVTNPSFPADYVPGLACLTDDLGVGSDLMPTIPNAAPFNTAAYTGYPQYQPNVKAKMCIAQEGWTAIGSSLIQHWTKVIDQSDSGIRLP